VRDRRAGAARARCQARRDRRRDHLVTPQAGRLLVERTARARKAQAQAIRACPSGRNNPEFCRTTLSPRCALVVSRNGEGTMQVKILDDILERLGALEAAVHGRNSTFFDRKLSKNQVALREGRSARAVERDVDNGTFPPPDEIVNGRAYWWLSTLERHDRERIHSATRTPPN